MGDEFALAGKGVDADQLARNAVSYGSSESSGKGVGGVISLKEFDGFQDAAKFFGSEVQDHRHQQTFPNPTQVERISSTGNVRLEIFAQSLNKRVRPLSYSNTVVATNTSE